MTESDKDVLSVNIEDELRQSYLDYAMSVIVGRALPDARDGLKPVHRRVLFAMQEQNNTWNRPYMKSARVVGEVIGKYHPHGDAAVYDTIVRMAQDFSMRYPLVDGQGNFGSMDGDAPAAMRYTEVRMTRLAQELLADLDKETVDFTLNYDETLEMPLVLPAAFPNLLVNGSDGIAVGMATKIPPHNLGEVIAACLALLDDPALPIDALMEHVTGPDFPTGATINGRAGIVQAYRSGRGRILVRARADVETDPKSGRDVIVVTEIPYQLNKARLIEKIAELVKEKHLEGISEIRDESDKDGLRIVIEVRRGDSGEVVLNNLYAQTQLQTVYGINCVALVEGRPKVLDLKQMLELFLLHRREVVTRRTRYLLRKARERGHLLEGQTVALSNVDPVIELIKTSQTPAEAKERLMDQGWASTHVNELLERAGGDVCRPDDLPERYGYRDGLYWLSPEQAQAILDLRLNRLTNMEQDKLRADYEEILGEIGEYREILGSSERLRQVIREELQAILERYGDDRRTEIVASQQDLTVEDLIEEEDRVVTISHAGYAKSQPLTEYEAQRRGGVGKAATALKDEDFVEHLLVANSHATVLCFSNLGKVYWLKVYQIPSASRQSRGRPMVNLLPLGEGERITAFLPVQNYDADHFVFMATANGTVKKTPLPQFARARSAGLIALDLEDGNTLVGASVTDGHCDVLLFTSDGKAVRFKESDVRSMGRTARGVRGVRLQGSARVISLIVPREDHPILTAASHGLGKRSPLADYPQKGRGTQGVIGMRLPDRSTELVAAVQVSEADEVMLISDQGTLVRIRANEISQLGRSAQGVKLVNVRDGEKLVGVARIEESPEQGDTDAAGPAPTGRGAPASGPIGAPEDEAPPEAPDED